MYAVIEITGTQTVTGTISDSINHRVYHTQVNAGGTAIPSRDGGFLDCSKIAKAQADADYILHTIFGK